MTKELNCNHSVTKKIIKKNSQCAIILFYRYVPVEKVIPHPNYSESSGFDYDFALLRLGQTIVMNSFIRPICLPKRSVGKNLLKLDKTVRLHCTFHYLIKAFYFCC